MYNLIHIYTQVTMEVLATENPGVVNHSPKNGCISSLSVHYQLWASSTICSRPWMLQGVDLIFAQSAIIFLNFFTQSHWKNKRSIESLTWSSQRMQRLLRDSHIEHLHSLSSREPVVWCWPLYKTIFGEMEWPPHPFGHSIWSFVF